MAYSPATRLVQPALTICAEAQREISLFVTEAPAGPVAWPRLEGQPVDLYIRLDQGAGFDGYAVKIAGESIAVILNAKNPVGRLTGEQVRGLFSGEIRSWDEIEGTGEVHPYVYLNGDDIRTLFGLAVLKDLPVSQDAQLAPDPEAMLKTIASDPLAIGYLPGAWVNDEVRMPELEPDLAQALAHPVLALAQAEPQGGIRLFLSCLQSGAGQEELLKRFSPEGG